MNPYRYSYRYRPQNDDTEPWWFSAVLAGIILGGAVSAAILMAAGVI